MSNIEKNICPFGGDVANDCADCVYSCDYHFVDGECVSRNGEPTKKNKVKGILLDVNSSELKVVTLADELDSYYKALNCSCIDIVERSINGKTFSIVCDDEGLMKADVHVSAFAEDYKPMLVGNLFIANSSYTPDGVVMSDLTDEDIAHIKQSCMSCEDYYSKSYRTYPVITNVSY